MFSSVEGLIWRCFPKVSHTSRRQFSYLYDLQKQNTIKRSLYLHLVLYRATLHSVRVFLRRLGAHGRGEFALPGGHLEFGESWEDCAKREVLEETGLQLSNLRFETAVNSVFGEAAHYVTIFMRGDADEVRFWAILLYRATPYVRSDG
jgi:8-oxo-dGTP pyrophosphatase MutT (NUDIX family)